jgi:phage shock protein PspC (stress-responsive transcriptional regulator)
MNTNRLYRSTSEAILGGVAAGLGNYFKIDPTIVRIIFVLATLLTSGGFLLVYLAMWLLIPAPGSTATEPGKIVAENLNEIGARVRNLTGGSGGMNGGTVAGTDTGAVFNPQSGAGGTGTVYAQGQVPGQGAFTQGRQGMGPVVLIALGTFFLLANLGLFHIIHWHMWWPLLLIGLGVLMLIRRNR